MDIFDDIQQGAADLSEVGIHAGFPNPAAERDHRKPTLSLDQLLVPRPNSTYFFRVEGHRWSDQGVSDGDLLIIDRAPRPTPYDVVVAWQDDFVLCRHGSLSPTVQVWGVVTAVVHRYRRVRQTT
jgi:DNA polymerase V